MKKRSWLFILVAALAVALNVGCANENPANDPTPKVVEDPIVVQVELPTEKWECQWNKKTGAVYARRMGETQEYRCQAHCLADKGCDAGLSLTIADQEFEQALQALELSETVKPQDQCWGPCAPGNMTLCGGPVTQDGELYPGLWTCVIFYEDDVCTLVPAATPCEDDQSCSNIGFKPQYGVCLDPVDCEADADCDDGEQCTTDTCINNKCVFTPNVAGSCDDGNLCTEDDVCDAFLVCAGVAKVCDDQNTCTINDACDPATGACISTTLPDGAVCSDGNFCTQSDLCAAGICAGAPLDCDDQNSCTTEKGCNPAVGCLYEVLADNTACDDGNLCTEGETCQNVVCMPGTPKVCDDQNPCTADSCDQATGDCVNNALPDGTDCAVGFKCVMGECVGDWCLGGTAGICADDKLLDEVSWWVCPAQVGEYGSWAKASVCPGLCVSPEGCVLPPVPVPEVLCADGLDNDQDGDMDCHDSDCAHDPACCVPACEGKQCGFDGCGGVCGICAPGSSCNQNGQCVVEDFADVFCWDFDMDDDGQGTCIAHSQAGYVYWSPVLWKLVDYPAPGNPPACNSASAGDPAPVKYPVVVACCHGDIAKAECDEGSNEWNPYAPD